MRGKKSGAHVHLPHQVETPDRGVEGAGQIDRAGIVDQHIDATEMLCRLLHRSLQRQLVAHIQLNRQCPSARLLHFRSDAVYRAGQFGMRFRRLASDHHLRAIPRTTQRDFTPDAATRAGDENCFAAQISH